MRPLQSVNILDTYKAMSEFDMFFQRTYMEVATKHFELQCCIF